MNGWEGNILDPDHPRLDLDIYLKVILTRRKTGKVNCSTDWFNPIEQVGPGGLRGSEDQVDVLR